MKRIIILIILLTFYLGGCMKEESVYDFGATTKIDDYIGQGNIYNNGESYIDFVQEKEDELIKVAINYMKQYYNLSATASSARPADGFSIVAVRIEEPFYFQTLVSIDNDNFNNVGIYGGLIDNDTAPGVYAWMHDEQIDSFDNLLNDLASKYNLKGFTDEAIANLRFGYEKSYYSITGVDQTLGEKFYEDVSISKSEMKNYYDETEEDLPHFNIKFYTEDEITNEKLDLIMKSLLQEKETLLEGTYSLSLLPDEILNAKGDSKDKGLTKYFEIKK